MFFGSVTLNIMVGYITVQVVLGSVWDKIATCFHFDSIEVEQHKFRV